MRVNNVQNNISFKSLQVRSQGYVFYKASDINRCREKLADTKFVDIIIDSQGISIKEKMTEVLQKIQSFSLLPLEKSVAINMIGDKTPKYKVQYPTLKKAKEAWNELREQSKNVSSIDEYTNIALWLEKNYNKK